MSNVPAAVIPEIADNMQSLVRGTSEDAANMDEGRLWSCFYALDAVIQRVLKLPGARCEKVSADNLVAFQILR